MLVEFLAHHELEKYLLPYLYKDTFDKEGYEGAVVLDPNPGIYINKPVAVLDYGSLYPSSMINSSILFKIIKFCFKFFPKPIPGSSHIFL